MKRERAGKSQCEARQGRKRLKRGFVWGAKFKLNKCVSFYGNDIPCDSLL